MSVSLVSQRVFHGSTDISVAVADHRSGTKAITYTAGQYFYIGSTAAITNAWIEMSVVASSTAGAPVVEIWWGQAWIPAVDIIDQTAGLTASGRISWAVDKFKGWDNEDKSEDVGLTGTNIYDRYWCRLSWPNNFTATLGYIGQKFSDDVALASYHPDLLINTDLLTGYKSGKTNWNEQHFDAAEKIVKDLRKRNIIKDKGNIYDWQDLEEASCHKVAEIVYSAFGAPYRESMNLAHKMYEAEIAKVLNIDIDGSGNLSEYEIRDRQGWMTR